MAIHRSKLKSMAILIVSTSMLSAQRSLPFVIDEPISLLPGRGYLELLDVNKYARRDKPLPFATHCQELIPVVEIIYTRDLAKGQKPYTPANPCGVWRAKVNLDFGPVLGKNGIYDYDYVYNISHYMLEKKNTAYTFELIGENSGTESGSMEITGGYGSGYFDRKCNDPNFPKEAYYLGGLAGGYRLSIFDGQKKKIGEYTQKPTSINVWDALNFRVEGLKKDDENPIVISWNTPLPLMEAGGPGWGWSVFVSYDNRRSWASAEPVDKGNVNKYRPGLEKFASGENRYTFPVKHREFYDRYLNYHFPWLRIIYSHGLEMYVVDVNTRDGSLHKQAYK